MGQLIDELIVIIALGNNHPAAPGARHLPADKDPRGTDPAVRG